MQQLNALREQATMLRDLAARTINRHRTRATLLALAKQCDELADTREELLASGALKSTEGE